MSGKSIVAQAATYLSDLPVAWPGANGAERKALPRMLFEQIRIKDGWVAAVELQPSLAPFFSWDCQLRRLSGGSDGDRCRHRVMTAQAQTQSILPLSRLAA